MAPSLPSRGVYLRVRKRLIIDHAYNGSGQIIYMPKAFVQNNVTMSARLAVDRVVTNVLQRTFVLRVR